MTTEIAFFSSDSRPLYKSDIYNATCLPHGYVIHFRYKSRNIQPELLKRLNYLKELNAVVFFAKSHESETGQLQLATENISIRDVKIVDISTDTDTDLIHFYLRLRDFKDYEVNGCINLIPPNFFVSIVKLKSGEKNKWSDRVLAIKNAFPGQLFFKFQLLKEKNARIIYPAYDPNENQSFFSLEDETEYLINIHFAHTDDITKGKSKFPVLKIKDKTKQIDINITEYIDIGVNLDHRKIRMVTKSISNNNIDSFLVFKVVVYDHLNDKFENVLQSFSVTSRITKKYFSVFLFALNSTLAVAAVGFMAIFVNDLRASTNVNYVPLLFSLIFTSISSGLLYRMFNKK